jgi:uncharacterized repeat protein (TIGR03803 family)
LPYPSIAPRAHRGSGGYLPTSLLVGNDGSLYGTTYDGGDFGDGSVFQLVSTARGWIENVIYSFNGVSDGWIPSNLFQDIYGNFYGEFIARGGGPSTFKLLPSNGQWVLSVVFQVRGGESIVALGMDSERLYGVGGGVEGGGCSGQNCLASEKPTGPVYYFGFFSDFPIFGFEGNGVFDASRGLVVGPGGRTMIGTTRDCGSYNNGTVWSWDGSPSEFMQ